MRIVDDEMSHINCRFWFCMTSFKANLCALLAYLQVETVATAISKHLEYHSWQP